MSDGRTPEKTYKGDQDLPKELSQIWGDEKAYGSAVKKNLEELKHALQSDLRLND